MALSRHEVLDNIGGGFNTLLDRSIPTTKEVHVCSFQEGQAVASVKGIRSQVSATRARFMSLKVIHRSAQTYLDN